MNRYFLALSLLLTCSLSYAQTIDFTVADPQPDLVEIYSGSSDSGDIDGDGDNDLIMSGISPSRKTALYLNDGNGNFVEVEDTPFPDASSSVTIFEDLDADGDLDLFFSGNGIGVQEFTNIYLNDGFGKFTLISNPLLPIFADSGVDIDDVDGDGDLDLLIAVKDANDDFVADVFLNNGNAVFSPLGLTVFDVVQFASVAFIDVENDGDADVIISGLQEDESVLTKFYLNDGDGNYSADTDSEFVQINADDIDVADLDDDGDLDVLMSGVSFLMGARTLLYINDGNGQLSELSTVGLQNTFAGTNVIADMDNDGDQDILIIGSQAGGLPNIFNIVYENLGDNVFTPVDTVGGEYIAACVEDDFNGDGKVDIIIQGFSELTTVYWNTSIITSLEPLFQSDLLHIYPNPSSGELNIHMEKDISDLSLYIYTREGRLVYEQPNVSGKLNELQIDLHKGTYIVLLMSDNSILSREVLIIN